METRANYALIGLFTLAVIAAAFGFVYWFSGGDRGQARQSVRIVFSGSVSGLSRGSVVSFNGIRVGEVTDIRLLPEDPRRVVAVVQVENETPIRTDTRARLEYQGLTGVAQIALSGGEPAAPPLTAGPGQPLPTIFADRSDFQDLMETARNIARRADDVLERVNKVITDNEGSVNRTIQNVERFSEALGNNSAGIDRFLEQVGQAAEKVGPLAEKLETLATNVDGVVRAIDREQVARIVSNVDQSAARLPAITENLQSLAGNLNNVAGAIDRDRVARIVENVDKGAERVPAITEKLDTLATTANDRVGPLADKLDGLANDADAVIKAIDREQVARVVSNIDQSAARLPAITENLQSLAGNLNNVAGAIDRDRVARIVENVDKGAERVPAITEKLDTLATTANDRVGPLADKLDGLANDADAVIKAIDRDRVSRIVENVDGFTQTLNENRQVVNDALRDAASLVKQLSTTAPKLDAAISDVGNLAKAVDPEKIGRTVDNADKFAQALGNSSQDWEKTVAEARSISEKLNKSADRIDGVLAAAQNFLGTAAGPEGKSTFDEIREAAKSVRDLANNLNERSAGLFAGLNRFSESGLREYEALAVEGRKTLTEISRAVRSLERNPQQLIFGGGRSNVPEYNGRR